MKVLGFGALEGIIVFIFAIGFIISWVFAMSIATEIAKGKGHKNLNGAFWFMGFFSGGILPCILAAALPDKKENGSKANKQSSTGDLPSI